MKQAMMKRGVSILLAMVMMAGLVSGSTRSAFAYDEEMLDDSYVAPTASPALSDDAEDAADAVSAEEPEPETDAQPEPDPEPIADSEAEEASLSNVSTAVVSGLDLVDAQTSDYAYEYTIVSNGIYNLTDCTLFTIAEGVTDVTFLFDRMTYDIAIDCTRAPGITLSLEDVTLYNYSEYSIIDFSGQGNILKITGDCILDYNGMETSTQAAIHVDESTSLSIEGDGTLYLYKCSGGAGIGGASGEANGDITFAMTGSAFMKGDGLGALVGSGYGGNASGHISFDQGTYNLIANSRGAAIGGYGDEEIGGAGTTAYFNGACVNINVNDSGAAVGGGGQLLCNDAFGGDAVISGGSLRVYIDKGAADHGDFDMVNEGVNDLPVTATKTNQNGEPVYTCVFDTSVLADTSDGYYSVYADGIPYYEGGLHQYAYVNEGLHKWNQSFVSEIPDNWTFEEDTCLYLYLTGEDHILTVNGEEFFAEFSWDMTGADIEHIIGAFVLSDRDGILTSIPAVTSQAAPVSYDVGDIAAALSVSGITGGGTVGYQWYASVTSSFVGATAVAGATSATYTPSTSVSGSTDYFCVVTDSNQSVIAIYGFPVFVAAEDYIAGARNTTVDFSWYDEDDPSFCIYTASQWNALAWIVSGQIEIFDSVAAVYGLKTIGGVPNETDNFEGKTIYLGSDIDMNGAAGWRFMPVGGKYYYDDDISAPQFSGAFCGSFNGQGYQIRNISADYRNSAYGIIGLFGQVNGDDSVIENVWVGDGTFTGANSVYAGVVVGTLDGANAIVQCCVNGASILTTRTAATGTGGIVGVIWNGSLYNCANFGDITSDDYALGGLVGQLRSCIVSNNYTTGAVCRGDGTSWPGTNMLVTGRGVIVQYHYSSDVIGAGSSLSLGQAAAFTATLNQYAGLCYLDGGSWYMDPEPVDVWYLDPELGLPLPFSMADGGTTTNNSGGSTNNYATPQYVDVVWAEQEKTNWCWAACAEMEGKAINPASTVTQDEIVSYTKGPTLPNTAATAISTAKAAKYASDFTATFDYQYYKWSWEKLYAEIKSGNPVIVLCGYYDKSTGQRLYGHYIVIVGCYISADDVKMVQYLDPDRDAETREFDYDTFISVKTRGDLRYEETVPVKEIID
ncbi:MAG: C39 family peptidase [Oscillospiraceae bacterium]|nr:C39 family peptidase [Oscillospiraceae bacterium]